MSVAESNTGFNTRAPIRQRCPGCFRLTDIFQVQAMYVHKATRRRFVYYLCPRCGRDLKRSPERIVRNVEAYFTDEIAAYDAMGAKKRPEVDQ